jgi:hypothetical protein
VVPTFKCVEIARESETGNGETFTIRAIRDANTDAQQVSQYGTEAVGAAANAISVYASMAGTFGFEFGHVTIVMLDPTASMSNMTLEELRGVFADANVSALPRECIIRMNIPLLDRASNDFLHAVMAHEVFHCVQGWSFWQSRHGARFSADHWWVEGTAVFFADLVRNEADAMAGLGNGFVTTIEQKPLTQQPSTSVVFFGWLWAQGQDKMAAFFKALPQEDGEDAQMRAVLKVVDEDALQKFAQDVIDGKVTMPNGYTFPAPPPQVETILFDGDQVQTMLKTKPFTITRVGLQFTNGTYSAYAGGDSFFKREQQGGPWSELDPSEKIKGDDCKDVRMLVAARFITSIMGGDVMLTGSRLSPCFECVKLPKMDKCLIGKWRLSNEALLSFLNAAVTNKKMANYSGVGGTSIVSFDENGTAQLILEDFRIGAEVNMEEGSQDVVLINIEGSGIDSGQWSTDDGGNINYCPIDSSIAFSVRTELPNGFVNTATQNGMMDVARWGYTCLGSDLVMQYTGPISLPPDVAPRWQLTRIP